MTQIELDVARDTVLGLIKQDLDAKPMELALATIGVSLVHGLLTDLRRAADALEKIADDDAQRKTAIKGLLDADGRA